MDLLVFDAKKRHRDMKMAPVVLEREELMEMTGTSRIEAVLNGGLIHIINQHIAEILHEMAGIGEWLEDEREENVVEIPAIHQTLILSPLETVFLGVEWRILDVKKLGISLSDKEIWLKMQELSEKNPANFKKSFLVYRFLRRNGWIVRSGATFGCDFLIYSLGAQHFHASAGVLIADEITPLQLLTLTRILAHNKKALMVATASGKDSEEEDVKIVTMKTYFLERDVSQMSNRANDLYDVVLENNKID